MAYPLAPNGVVGPWLDIPISSTGGIQQTQNYDFTSVGLPQVTSAGDSAVVSYWQNGYNMSLHLPLFQSLIGLQCVFAPSAPPPPAVWVPPASLSPWEYFLSGPSLRPPFDVRPRPFVGCHIHDVETAEESQEEAFTFKRYRTPEGFVRRRSPSPIVREKSRSPSLRSPSLSVPSFSPPAARTRGRYTRSRSPAPGGKPTPPEKKSQRASQFPPPPLIVHSVLPKPMGTFTGNLTIEHRTGSPRSFRAVIIPTFPHQRRPLRMTNMKVRIGRESSITGYSRNMGGH